MASLSPLQRRVRHEKRDTTTKRKVLLAYAVATTVMILSSSYLIYMHIGSSRQMMEMHERYNVIMITQFSSCLIALNLGAFILLKKLRLIDENTSTFKTEKNSIILTVVSLTAAFIFKIICAALQLADLIALENFGEVGAVQLEISISIVSDTIPLFFFLCQHRRHLTIKPSRQEKPAILQVQSVVGVNADQKTESVMSCLVSGLNGFQGPDSEL